MLGPKKPPRLPIELMKAIPAAAAVPARRLVGMAQNGPTIENTPTRARLIEAIITKTEVENAAIKSATAPVKTGSATLQRRSPVRQEWTPTRTITMAAAI